MSDNDSRYWPINNVFYDGVNSANRCIHTSAMENTMLPIAFRNGKI